MSEKTDLSIIVPSYNESWEIKKDAIDSIESYVNNLPLNIEVLIADDESTNNTREKVKDYVKNKKNFKLLEFAHGGKAITVMNGLLESKGEIALFTDMDQATPITELKKLLDKFVEGYDIVIGVRKDRKGAPVIRKIAAFSFITLRNIILGLPISDTQCGFKAFKREAINTVLPQMLESWQNMKIKGAAVNAGFDIELLFIAKDKGFKIAEVPVEWHHVQNEKQVQIVKDGMEALRDMIRIRKNHLSGKYEESK